MLVAGGQETVHSDQDEPWWLLLQLASVSLLIAMRYKFNTSKQGPFQEHVQNLEWILSYY